MEKSFSEDQAVAVILELVKAGKITLPADGKYNMAHQAPDLDALYQERARVQARYLRHLLAELTKPAE